MICQMCGNNKIQIHYDNNQINQKFLICPHCFWWTPINNNQKENRDGNITRTIRRN